jgi:catechol 2,3-dioxygenase-like lactoylglutathione lyase family enzyme
MRDMSDHTTDTNGPRLDAIGIVVSDLGKSLAFYRRLGLDVPDGAEDQPHVEASLPGGLRVLWDTVETVRSFDPDWEPPSGSPRAGLAFACATAADVDATYESLVGLGYEGHKAPWDAPWGQRYAMIRDPDGNSVDLFAPL